MIIYRLTTIVTLAALIANCAVAPSRQDSKKQQQVAAATSAVLLGSSIEDARRLEQQGEYIESAKIYGKLSQQTGLDVKTRNQLKLRAAYVLSSGNLPNQARFVLKEIDTQSFDKETVLQYSFVRAKIALAERNATDAKRWLQRVNLPANAPLSVHAEFIYARIRLHELSGDIPAIVRDRIQLTSLIGDKEQRLANQAAIFGVLSMLSIEQLEKLMDDKTASPTYLGWIKLAMILQQSNNPSRLNRLLQKWKLDYAQHPVSPELLNTLVPQQSTDAQPPDLRKIALLLPFKGPYEKQATAIRDGFLAAYYAQDFAQGKPEIRIYDTGDNAEDIENIYEQAVDDGASIVVGPLNKTAVESLAGISDLTVPTIALNQIGEKNFYRENFYQFGLFPEDEARQIAERAWLDGHNNAAVVYPEGPWGERIFSAFKEEWEKRGGSIISSGAYPSKKSDFSTTLKKILNLDESNERFRSLSKILGTRLIYEPRRRQDIDLIFMIAHPRQARLIPPQLKFHRAGDIPIYATSHSYTGKIDRSKDRDMNGVVFGDMPWTLQTKKTPQIKKDIIKTWPRDAKSMGRLYALGVDAYNVLYYINWLRTNPNARLAGVTGNLHMDINNHLTRQLTWAKFRGGKPGLLSSTRILSSNQ